MNPEPPTCCDCLVVGGGPAGATLAGLLSAWGRTSVLVHDGRDRHGMPEETMLPAAARVLERCGLASVMAEHRFFGLPRHGVLWGQDALEVVSREESERGFQVDRRLFDAALRGWARRCGATVLDDHRVPGRLPEAGQGAVRVQPNRGEPFDVQARTLVVATGRNTPSALVEVELEATGSETVAVSMVGDGDPSYTDASVIEAVPEGWLWWLPLRDGGVCLSTFLDGQQYRDVGRLLLDSALSHARGPAAGLTGGELRYAAKSTPRLQRTDSGVLLVGDAASTVDPLSSQGLEKALCSAEIAACAVNTVLDTPELQPMVGEYQEVWERGLWHAHAEQTAAFYGREGRHGDVPFWRLRRAVDRDEPERAELPPQFRLHPQLLQRPVLQRKGRLLVEETGFALPGSRETWSRLGAVPLEPLMEVLGRVSGGVNDLPGVLQRAAQQALLFPLSPRVVSDAVEDLFRRGLVIAAEQPDSR